MRAHAGQRASIQSLSLTKPHPGAGGQHPKGRPCKQSHQMQCPGRARPGGSRRVACIRPHGLLPALNWRPWRSPGVKIHSAAECGSIGNGQDMICQARRRSKRRAAAMQLQVLSSVTENPRGIIRNLNQLSWCAYSFQVTDYFQNHSLCPVSLPKSARAWH